MTVLLVLGFLASMAMAWWSLFRVLPETAVSQLRYRLWWIRDSVALELIDGAYENRTEPLKFVREVEAVIRAAPHLTFLRFWILRRLGRSIEAPPYDEVDLSSLNAADRDRLEMWKYHLDRAVIWHSLVGSVVGWVVLAVVVALAFPRELIRSRWGRRERVVRTPLVDDSQLVIFSSRTESNGSHSTERVEEDWRTSEIPAGDATGWVIAVQATKNVVHDEFEDAVEPTVAYAASGVALPWSGRRFHRHEPVSTTA